MSLYLLLSLLLFGCDGGDGVTAHDAEPETHDASMPMDAPPEVDATTELDAAVAVDADAEPPRPPPARWFEDVTAASGVDFVRTGVDGYTTLPDRMSGGVCVVDVDGTPPFDLFFAMRRESRLYVASAPLAYEDQTESRGLGGVGDAMGCLAFDADADGDRDLLVTELGAVRLFQNDGGSFVDASHRIAATVNPTHMFMSASAGDIDGDRDLDILVSGFLAFDLTRHDETSNCGAALCTATLMAYEYVPDLLLELGADGVWRNVAATRAPDLTANEPGLVSVIRDFDGDRRPDLFVGNDLGYTFDDRVLVREATGRFVDVAPALGMAHDWRGYGIDTMGFASGDLTGDGHVDHVTTSFETDATAVFVWRPPGRYEDWSVPLGTHELRFTFRWGVALVDLDLDGDLDLFEATGHFHSDAEIASIGYMHPRDQQPNLMVNVGGGTLRHAAPVPEDGMHVARSCRGLAVTDIDEDGRPDIVMAPAVGPAALLRNVKATDGHFLRITLVGHPPNREGIGARVTVRAPEGAYLRERILGEGYLGSFDPRLFFGLPAAAPVDVSVRWPSGAITTVAGVGVDGDLTIAEP